MEAAAGGGAGRARSGSMERCVEEFLRSVRNGEASLNMSETISTEHALGTQDKASHSAVQKTEKKNKSIMKSKFHCRVCNVAVYNYQTYRSHVNGKKHRRKFDFFTKIHVGKEYVRIYEHPGGILVPKCDLCCEEILDVSNHLTSYSHILAVLGHTKQLVSDCANLTDVRSDIRAHAEGNVCSHGGCVFKECTARSDLKPIESETPVKITCNKDLYTFLQHFQISDETDVIFIQQIVQKFKSQLQEFNENDQQVTTISELIDDKDQGVSISKLNFSRHSESILQHADSTTTSTANESTTNKSADIKDHSKGECRTNHAGNSQLCTNMSGRRIENVPTVDHLPECNSSKVTTTQATASNPVSSHRSSVMLCPTTKKPMIRPSASTSLLKSHHQFIASIKKEPDDATVEEPQLDCTTATNATERVLTATASSPVSLHRSSVMLCPTTKKPMIRPSASTSLLKSHHQFIASIKKEPNDATVEEPQLDCTTATNATERVLTGTTGSHLPVFYSSGTLSTGKPKCIIRPSVLSSVLKKSLPLESHVSGKKKPDTLASDQHQASPEGCIGPTKVQSHCSMSEFGKDQPPSRCLESYSSDKNKVVPAAKKPRIDHLNISASTSHRHDAAGISFGGKKDMQISELIAEVSKFAERKPVLKGMDINQVVQILIRNRSEKTRNENEDSTE